MIPVPGMQIRKGNIVNVIHAVMNSQVYYGRIYLDGRWGEPGYDYWGLHGLPLDDYFGIMAVEQIDGIKSATGELLAGEDWEAKP